MNKDLIFDVIGICIIVLIIGIGLGMAYTAGLIGA